MSSIVAIAKKVCPAVITIVASKDLPKVEGFYMMPFSGGNFIMPKVKKGKKEQVKIGGGSGFIVSPDGLVITSRHVVEDRDAEYTVVVEPRQQYPAKILARDPIHDIAILKVAAKNLPSLQLGNSDSIELGQEVVAVGNALGEFHDTVSSGIVSGLSRFIQATNHLTQQAQNMRGLIQTDAAINPGNSGGPLVDTEGNVIGINTAMVMGAQNIGFAIPINVAKQDLEQIEKFGKIKVPFLGLKYIILSKEIAKQNKLPVDYGALVIRQHLGESPIVKGLAADKAGFKEFDIILDIEGEKITLENPLSDLLQKHAIGSTVTMKVLRNKKQTALKVTLEEKK